MVTKAALERELLKTMDELAGLEDKYEAEEDPVARRNLLAKVRRKDAKIDRLSDKIEAFEIEEEKEEKEEKEKKTQAKPQEKQPEDAYLCDECGGDLYEDEDGLVCMRCGEVYIEQ